MTIGVVRSLQLVATLVVAGPVAVVGVVSLADGLYLQGAFFLVAAAGLVAVGEYVYVRLTDRTVGRLHRLSRVGIRERLPWRSRRRGDEDE